ncbi:MAG: signal peptidase I [Nanoarchaeota archaeon]|nr:signal peptidase I [Nanoarchaeota archaeon]
MVWDSIRWIAAMFTMLFLGIFIGMNAYSIFTGSGIEKPLSLGMFSSRSAELDSPSDHISEDNIHVFSDKVVIDIKDASWASFTDTNSMDPFIDSGANSIEVRPSSAEDIQIGDVISFRTALADGLIIHRVVAAGADDSGAYFITKGDNNDLADPGARRFEDITGVVVGVIY